MFVSVAHHRKKVKVLSFGETPICIVKNAKTNQQTIVSNGFKVSSKCCGREWIGLTKVDEDGKGWYQFYLADEKPDECSWRESPTAAFGVANENCKNTRYKPGTNGALVIGISYPAIQNLLKKQFQDELTVIDERENSKRFHASYLENDETLANDELFQLLSNELEDSKSYLNLLDINHLPLLDLDSCELPPAY